MGIDIKPSDRSKLARKLLLAGSKGKKKLKPKLTKGFPGVPQPMTGRNALKMYPDPNDPSDYSGEIFRGEFPSGRRNIYKDLPEQDASQSELDYYASQVQGKKYGVRDWNLATQQAKKWLKEHPKSKAPLPLMRAEMLEEILVQRWNSTHGQRTRYGEGWPREEGTMGDPDTEWGSLEEDPLAKKRLLSRMKKDRERVLKRAEEEKKHKDIRESIKRGK